MTTPMIEAPTAAVPTLGHACGVAVISLVSDVVAAIGALPLRERVDAIRLAAQELFADMNAPVVDWGDDAGTELSHDAVTVDEELAGLRAERGALVEVIADAVALTRSLEASTRVLADQHARVVSRFDTLDADQLERRLSSPATALAGEFACDDFAPLLGVSSTAAAKWAETGSVLRARHPRLLALAGQGVVRVRACEVVAGELAHLEPERVDLVEAEFLAGDLIHGSEASIRRHLRRLLDHHGLARPRDEGDEASRIGLGFNEIPEQPTLTELNVVMSADNAWRLNAAIEARARALIDEWAQAHEPGDSGYPIRRARVDALLDLALGGVKLAPEVRITVPVKVATLPPDRSVCASPSGLTPTVFAGAALSGSSCTPSMGYPEQLRPAAAAPQRRGGSTMPESRFRSSGDSVVRVADLDVPRIGRVSADALVALGETLGAHVTVALADADSGITAWTSATTYRPALSLRRFVEARDENCRFPGCMRPAPMCDVDHVTPHVEGGATSPANLQLLCRHHHRAKTHGAWAVTMTPDGVCAWQSPVGDWFRTHPADATAYRIAPTEGLAIAAEAKARRTRPAA